MAYSPPVITSAGLSIPSFAEIQAALIQSYQTVYGATAYLGNDSADYQWISSVALKLTDNMRLCQLAYNARSPQTAIGADLDGVVKLNGLTRLPSSPSTVVLRLTGTPETLIAGGSVVQDVNGVLWSIPVDVTIGGTGSSNVTAQCQQTGPINAKANTVTYPVGGFTAGWTGVTNPSDAVLGTAIESDSSLRARQSISVAAPSSTRLAGTIADLLKVPGVTLINVLENQTSVTDSYGNEGHSLTCVVQGGLDLDIATSIYNNRGIGCNTQGATATAMTVVAVTDPKSGVVTNIGFIRPTLKTIYATLSIHGLTSAFNTAVQTEVINAVVAYLTGLQIGEEVTQSALYGAALSVMPNLKAPIFSIRALTLGTTASPTGTVDIPLQFFELSTADNTTVTITVV